MIVRDLVNKIGFKVNDTQLKRADASVANFKKHLLLLTAAATAATVALYALVKTTASYGDMLDKTAEALGFTVEQYQLLGGAAELSGISMDMFTKSMKKFNNAIGQAAMGGQGGLKVFNELGIGIRKQNGQIKTNLELLLEVAERYKQIKSPQERLAIAQELFSKGGMRMVNMFKNGSAGLKELMKQFGDYTILLDKDAVEASVRFTDQLFLLKASILGVKRAIGIALLPQINAMVKSWLEWFKANKQLAVDNINAAVQGLVILVVALGKALVFIGKVAKDMTKIFGGFANTLKIVEGFFIFFISTKLLRGMVGIVKAVGMMAIAFKGLATAAGLADLAMGALPALIIAILAAIALLTNDLANFMEGKDSLIGRFLEAFTAAMAKVKESLMHPLRAHVETTQKSMVGRTFFGLPTIEAFDLGIPAMMPAKTSHEINANTTVNMTVPAGTTEAQSSFLKKAARDTFDEVWQNNLRDVITTFPRTES